ncbi:MAG: alpha-galactosidase [Acidimicrobiia bacterium]|nr:alpha-galactosidase [Acidimicrobiia bacterium]
MLTGPLRIEVHHADGQVHRSDLTGDGRTPLGPYEVAVEHLGADGWRWTLANRSNDTCRPRSVRMVHGVEADGPLRMFRHGYQSWSACDTAVLGHDRDPSLANTTGIEQLQGVHHADQRTVTGDELRSEWVTVLVDDRGSFELVGFLAGTSHDGTFRLRTVDDTKVELASEAFLGGATLAPGEQRSLHPVVHATGAHPSPLLERWATAAGQASGARTDSPYQLGWCSWYHYFHDVTEQDLRSNLARAGDWPFDVFQLDDGFQAAIGDWLETNDKFPTELDGLAATIAAGGYTPGLWIAPFIVAPDSSVATEHPDWLARTVDNSGPLPGMFNPPWGGGMDGIMWALDTTNPEVLDHLEAVARGLRQRGYPYLKLDFTFAPSFDGLWHDPAQTPAERVRAGYEAIRRGAGADAFLLGCGAPLSHVVGVVDGNRIGSDVAPSWHLGDDAEYMTYRETEPATLHGFRNTLARSFQHRRLWLNDPDCLMLRTEHTALSPDAARTWARTVGLSGGMALVSDDLTLLDDEARHLLEDTIALGRAADAEAASGRAPRCTDLMDATLPTVLEAAGHRLEVDLRDGSSTFTTE